MAPKRRTSTPATKRGQQSSLSFGKQGHNRITKPTAAQANNKNAKKDAALLDIFSAEITEPTTAEAAIEEQTVTSKADSDPLESAVSKIEDVLGGKAPPTSDIGAIDGKTGSGWLADEEIQARRISDSRIKTYWRNKEAERKAPRLHQERLTVNEKILREFDMSGQFGPCIGIARLKRWKRANTLKLGPPIEVLAVLLKEVDNNNSKAQRAHVDELMSSRFVET